MLNYDQAFIKNELLNKFPGLSYTIADDEPCYAVSASWWLTFKWILNETRLAPDQLAGDPGPINNTDILETDDETRKLIITTILCDSPANDKLDTLSLWNKMKLKSNLRYNEDFVIVSSRIWNFLHKLFGGGPVIELFPEKYDEYTNNSKSLITEDDEESLDFKTCVNLELKRVNVIKDKDALTRYSFYVSLGANAKLFFQSVCQNLRVSYNQARFSYYDDDINSKPIVTSSSSDTLAELGIKENTVITVTRVPVQNISNNPIFSFDDELFRLDQINDLPLVDVPDLTGFQNIPDENISTKTDSTGIPNQNSIELDDILQGTGGGGMNIRPDFFNIQIPVNNSNQININELQEKIKKTATEEKIELTYKPLKEIRQNLIKLQAKWLQPLKPNPTKK